jgi:glycosyltransferase involved in cell wall biosynthesis
VDIVVRAADVKAPKFSAIICCYNYEQFVEQAIRSVAEQNYSNIECIIVDDGSTDGSAELIRDILEGLKDPRFRFFSLLENSGQTSAMMAGLDHASGTFVAFLDADDFWASDFVSSHIAAHLNGLRTAGMSCSDMALVSADGELLAKTWMSLYNPNRILFAKPRIVFPLPLPVSWLEDTSSTLNPIATDHYHCIQGFPSKWFFAPTSAAVYRRSLLNALRIKDLRSRPKNPDYLFNMLCSSFTGCIIIDKPAAFYRLHGENIMSTNPFAAGKHWMSGYWTSGDVRRMSKLMTAVIIENYDSLKLMYGHWFIIFNVLRVGWARPLYAVGTSLWLTIRYLLFADRGPAQGFMVVLECVQFVNSISAFN